MAEEAQSERLQMRVSPEFLRKIDDWRRGEADLPPRSEAIRRLVEMAIESTRPRSIKRRG